MAFFMGNPYQLHTPVLKFRRLKMTKTFTEKEMAIIEFALAYIKANLDDAKELTNITETAIINLEKKLKGVTI
jgi:hypothetical protein